MLGDYEQLSFLHCKEEAFQIWNRLLGIIKEHWFVQLTLKAVLAINFIGFGLNKEHEVLGRVLSLQDTGVFG